MSISRSLRGVWLQRYSLGVFAPQRIHPQHPPQRSLVLQLLGLLVNMFLHPVCSYTLVKGNDRLWACTSRNKVAGEQGAAQQAAGDTESRHLDFTGERFEPSVGE